MNLKKQLQTVNDKIKALAKTVDKMIAVLDTPEKAKPAAPKAKPVAPKAKPVAPKAKPVAPKAQPVAPKAQPVKKVVAKKKTVNQPVAVKEVVKESGKGTAADAVFAVIKDFNKGVNTSSLMEKTGFNEKKIQNIVFKLKKQGKIKSLDKGVYVTV